MNKSITDEKQRVINAFEALAVIQSYNRINNDLESYLFELAEWGLGKREIRPQPKDFGLEQTNVSDE